MLNLQTIAIYDLSKFVNYRFETYRNVQTIRDVHNICGSRTMRTRFANNANEIRSLIRELFDF
jgi:hypothetical protein